MRQLNIKGAPRPAVIEEAIGDIQREPSVALRARYFGVKNYAAFGDQREDYEYGMGPRHGSIVFSIGRNPSNRGPLDDDAIYYLEAYRDFPGIKTPVVGGIGPRMVWLGEAISARDRLLDEMKTYDRALCDCFVTSGVVA